MGKKTDQDIEMKHGRGVKRRACRVAYTLNNHQPVLCTLLHDQPFFYMDEDIPFEDDDILSEGCFDGDFEMLETEIAGLRRKIEAYDRLSLEFTQPNDRRFQEFLTDADFIGASFEKPVLAGDRIEEIQTILRESRMAQALMGFAEENKVTMACSDEVETSVYDRKNGKIYINSNLDLTEQILLAAQELRRHWQHRQGVLLHPLGFHPDQAVLVNRAQLADLSVAMVRVGWELQLAGNKSVWQRIENSSMADLGRAFAREAYLDFRTLNNGAACSAAFETWFLSERCRQQDKKLIQNMLNDYQGYVCDTSEEASRMISIDLICALGSQPFGKNYLAPYAQMIMNDPVFTEVRDRSNANFLWFIKFERSFRETEQELQSDGVIHSQGDRLGLFNNNPEGIQNEQKGQLVTLRSQHSISPRGEDGLEAGKHSANVLYVQFGTSKA